MVEYVITTFTNCGYIRVAINNMEDHAPLFEKKKKKNHMKTKNIGLLAKTNSE